MKKLIIAALVLLIAQIGLSLALNIGNKGIEAGPADTLFLSFSPAAVQAVAISDADGRELVLEKSENGWTMPRHFSAPADADKVKRLLDKLSGLKQGFVVATSAGAARRFKVDAESFASHVVLKGVDQSLADFYVGTSPVFRQVHARREDSNAIVTLPLAAFELESAPDKWLDTTYATIEAEDLVGLEINDIELQKEAGGWEVPGLQEGEKISRTELDALLAEARGLRVQDVLDPAEVSGLFGQPTFRYSADTEDGRKVEYFFARGEGEFYVLKRADQDLYFKVAVSAIESLQGMTREKLIEKKETTSAGENADSGREN